MFFHICGSANKIWGEAAEKLYHQCTGGNIQSQPSRCGNTIEIMHAVLSIQDIDSPWVWMRTPPINIAFALADFVWILSGRSDSHFINKFNTQYPKYAGYHNDYHGAYGPRLFYEFGINQIESVYNSLKNNNNGRQNILQIWVPYKDLPFHSGKPRSTDIPCAVNSMLKIRGGKLFWTQIFRSNDIFRGLPYDLIIGMLLLRTFSAWLNVGIGEYVHYCDSLHLYEDEIELIENSLKNSEIPDPDYDTPISNLKFPESMETTLSIATSITKSFCDISGKDPKKDFNNIKKLIGNIQKKDKKRTFFCDIVRILGAELFLRDKTAGHNENIDYLLENVETLALRNLWNNWKIYLLEKRRGVL